MNIVDKIIFDPITRGLKFLTKSGAMVNPSDFLLHGKRNDTEAVTVASATPTNIATVMLTPGAWLITGALHYEGGTFTQILTAITTVSATVPGADTLGNPRSGQIRLQNNFPSTAYGEFTHTIPCYRHSVSVNTPIWIMCNHTSTVSPAVSGFIQAIKVGLT